MTPKAQCNRMSKIIFCLLIALLLTSCGPAYNLKRSEIQLQKAIRKGAKVSTDSTIKITNLKLAGVKVEFKPKGFILNDTIYFAKEKVTTKVFLKQDSIFVETQCPDTVFSIKEKTVYRTITATKKVGRVPWYYWLLVAGLSLAVLGLIFRR